MPAKRKLQHRHAKPPGKHLQPVRRAAVPSFVFGVLLIVAIMVVYQPSLSGPFLFDDAPAVQKNESIRSLWPIGRVLAPPPYTPVADRPVSNLSFALNYAVADANPRAYRMTNLALHGLCALLLWWIVRKTLHQPVWSGRFDTSADLLAGGVALLWAIHPLLVDAVAYVTQRTELLVSLFYLLTLACAIRGWDAAGTSRRTWFILSILACALGMGSKEVMVSAPLAVLLYDRTFISGGFVAALVRSRWLYIGLAMTWIWLGALVAGEGRGDSAGWHLGVSAWEYLLTQSRVICWYLSMAIWPVGQSINHRVAIETSLMNVLPQAIALSALLLATVIGIWRWPRAAFPLACFFMVLAPTSSFYPIILEVAAERRMYLPLASLVSLLVPLAWVILSRFRLAPAGLLILVIAAVVLAALTGAHASRYGDDLRVWDHAIALDPQNATAHHNRGAVLFARKRYDDAIASFRAAIAAKPDHALARYTLGQLYAAQRKFAEAIEQLEASVQAAPHGAPPRQLLARTLMQQGKVAQAANQYEAALRIEPDWSIGLNDLAWIRATSSDDSLRNGRQAVELAQRACALDPRPNPQHLDTLAAAYAEAGDFPAAIATIETAIRIAEGAGAEQLARDLGSRRELYQRRLPHRAAHPSTQPN